MFSMHMLKYVWSFHHCAHGLIIHQSNPKALPYRNSRFPHYDLMTPIMSDAPRGVHAFHPSQQSHGAASSRPASSTRGKGAQGRAKGKEKGKEREQVQAMDLEIDIEPCNNSTGKDNDDHNRPAITLPPSPLSTSAIASSTSASISAASSSKRKHSALDSNSVVSFSYNSSSKKLKPPATAVLIESLSNNIGGMSEAMHGLTTECKAARIQAATQAEQASVASSSKLTTEEVVEAAILHLQELKSHLDPTRLVALIDCIQREPSLGRVYMALQ
jgi:hypothetical protein